MERRANLDQLNDLSPLLKEAIENLRDDRATTSGLLADVIIYLKKNADDRIKEIGVIAAKYVETLQRSNEQLVKIATALEKKEKSLSFSDDEKDEMFNQFDSDIQKGK